MAGNFWQSSHCQQWILDKQVLMKDRQTDLQILTEEEYQKVMIFYAGVIQALGEQLKVRQQVVSTATIYFKRFYSKNNLKSIDPLLMSPTCLFLASKVEEFGPLINSRLISACQSVVKKLPYAFSGQEFPYTIKLILECEFYLLEIMDCCLIVYHPYRPLIQYASDLGQEDQLLPLAWHIINDSLRTDVCLLYPPYLIALASLHMACVISQNDHTKIWFADLNVDLDKILEITQQILKLYDLWENYDEKKEIASVLAKVPKPQPIPPPTASAATSDS
ncbi:cyclin-C-like [Lytechinus pictus]|uniref:cyclin-C-like n=1 Tax=Lytechinus pictus TaxID=7653 RepID=UPI0030B9FF00